MNPVPTLPQLSPPALVDRARVRLCVHSRQVIAKGASNKLPLPQRAKATEELGRNFRRDVEATSGIFAPIGWRPTGRAIAALRENHPTWPWLRPTTVVVRNLPSGSTAADVESSFERVVASEGDSDSAGRKLEVTMWEALDGAFVDLGQETSVKVLLEEAGKPAGVSLVLAAEATAWEGKVNHAQTEYASVLQPYQAAKAAEADAEAAIAEKREELGNSGWKRFEKKPAGQALKKARTAAVNALSKPGADGSEPLAKRYHEAKKRFEKMSAGRRAWLSGRAPDTSSVTVEGCFRFKEEPRRRFATELLDELRMTIVSEEAEKAGSRVKLAELRPYVEKLRHAHDRGLEPEVVEQSGFQELFALERGQPTTAVCPICYESVGSGGPIAVTPCAHLFCRGCMLSWMNAQNVIQAVANRMGAAAETRLCPCCRHPFSVPQLIEIEPQVGDASVDPSPSSSGTAGTTGTAGTSSSEAGPSTEANPSDEPDARHRQARTSPGKRASGRAAAAGPSVDGDCDGAAAKSADEPTYRRAYTQEAYEAMAPPAGRFPAQFRLGRCPSIPSALLGHIQAATGLPPGSSARSGSAVTLAAVATTPHSEISGLCGPAGSSSPSAGSFTSADSSNGAGKSLVGRGKSPGGGGSGRGSRDESGASRDEARPAGHDAHQAAEAPVAREGGGVVVPSSKIIQLLADLEALGDDEHGVPLKAVIFSQHRAAIKHVDFILSHAGVPHVTICKGDAQSNLESAVTTWKSRPSCRAFLLHAGAAAAGLTLVAARHVFLLEPFDKPGQELQALNRCHRIGQTKPVSCTVYYADRTVEERLLALRALEQHKKAPQRGSSATSDETEGMNLLAEGSALPSRQKLRFLFGLLRQQQGNNGKEREEGGDEDEDGDEEDEDEEDDEESEEEGEEEQEDEGSELDAMEEEGEEAEDNEDEDEDGEEDEDEDE